MGFLFGSKPKAADPTPMPVATDDAKARAAARRQRASIFGRQGRSSTLLTDKDKGASAYNNSTLGQTN